MVAPTTVTLFWHPRQTKTNQCLLQNRPHSIRKDCPLNNNARWPAGSLVSQRQRRMRTTCQASHSVGEISAQNASWSSRRSTNKSLPITLQGVLEPFKPNLNKMRTISLKPSSKIPPDPHLHTPPPLFKKRWIFSHWASSVYIVYIDWWCSMGIYIYCIMYTIQCIVYIIYIWSVCVCVCLTIWSNKAPC